MCCVESKKRRISSVQISLFMVVVLGSLITSCGRAVKRNPTGARNNLNQAQTSVVPSNAVTSVSKINPAMIGGYTLNKAQCNTSSGPDAGSSDPIQLLTGYNEVLIVNDTDLTIAGSKDTCSYQIKLGLAGITDKSVYVQVASFHAYENSVDVTASISTNSACSGVVSNLSGISKLISIDYSYDASKATFVLNYPVASGSYCGDGNREVDTYIGYSE